MKISLNDKMPTVEQLIALSTIVPTSFSLGEWKYYEENIEWDDMEIIYPNGDVLRCADYTGLWELIALESMWDMMNDELKLHVLDSLFAHIGYYFSNQRTDIDEAPELFTERPE